MKTVDVFAETLDIFEFARQRAKVAGKLAVETLPKLCSFLAGTGGEVEFDAEGVGERRGRPAVRLVVSGDVERPCRYCNRPVRVHFKSDQEFLFVKTEEEADARPIDEDEEDEEVTVGSERFSIDAWVEEEAILSLPAVAEHEPDDKDCTAGWEAPEEPEGFEKPNPFAELALLKKK